MTERDLTGLRGRDRGQTTQDFATGISVFLLTVMFTFTFVPSTVTPFGSPVTDAIPAKSDRVASTVVERYATDDRSRTLDFEEMDGTVIGGSDVPPSSQVSGEDLRSALGLRETAQVNVTIRHIDDDSIVRVDYDSDGTDEALVGGDTYSNDQAAASTTRVVRLAGVPECEMGCLLVVRVW